jgi:hypothetical protein
VLVEIGEPVERQQSVLRLHSRSNPICDLRTAVSVADSPPRLPSLLLT